MCAYPPGRPPPLTRGDSGGADAYNDFVVFADMYRGPNGSYELQVSLTPEQYYAWPMLDIVIALIVAPLIIMVLMYSLWRLRTRSSAVREVRAPARPRARPCSPPP